ncbi:MAG: hypothetical protein RMK89_03470 [Armatimonadota bacterium]|nr:hypothetical protein [Armatimonadota bacterium]MDW8142504.1 hypothetical protein [Armatimonadota bacterium]
MSLSYFALSTPHLALNYGTLLRSVPYYEPTNFVVKSVSVTIFSHFRRQTYCLAEFFGQALPIPTWHANFRLGGRKIIAE